MRLGMKLILGFLVVGLTGVALVAVIASRATENEFGRFMFDRHAESTLAQLRDYYVLHDGWDGVDVIAQAPFEVPAQAASQYGPPTGAITQTGGKYLAPTGTITLADARGVVVLAGPGFAPGISVPSTTLAGATAVQVDSQVVGWFIPPPEGFGRNPAELSFLNRTNRLLLVGALGGGSLSLLLGVLLTRTLTRPIRELTAASRAIASGDLDQNVPVRSRDELGELAAAFNQMSSDLARARDLRRQMTADIAHELRTPLSIILGQIDALDDGVVPPSAQAFDILREETGRLGRLVEELRILSMADAGELTLVRRLVQPRELLEQAQAAHQPLAAAKDVSIRLRASPDLPEAELDPDRLLQVLGNLLSNALRHAPAASEIELAAESRDAGIELTVRDAGPGIDAADLPHLFDRFYRTDKARQRESGGSGLGLAIAKAIVEVHGGRIWAESDPGQGTVMAIWLPTAPS